MRSKTPDRPEQRVAPAQDFPSEEAFQTVVQDLVGRRDGHHGRCRFHEAEARRIGAEIDALRQELDRLTSKKNQEEHYAGQERNSCQGFEVTLARIGAQVPPPADPSAPPQTPQGDFTAHAAQFGGPLLPPRQEAALASFEAAHDALAAGEVGEPLGLRAAALQQHPYADPTPTGTHPLARPEGEAR